jgi:PhnB protein
MADSAQGPTGGVTPYLSIRDQRGAEAADWYVRAFGGQELDRKPAEDGVRLIHCHLRINGASVMLSDQFPEYTGDVVSGPPEGVTLHLQTGDPDAVWNPAVAAGAQVTMPLAEQFWGDRYGQLRDPFGHSWSIGGPSRG